MRGARRILVGAKLGINILNRVTDVATKKLEANLSGQPPQRTDVGCGHMRAIGVLGHDQVKGQEDAHVLVVENGLVGVKRTPNEQRTVLFPTAALAFGQKSGKKRVWSAWSGTRRCPKSSCPPPDRVSLAVCGKSGAATGKYGSMIVAGAQ